MDKNGRHKELADYLGSKLFDLENTYLVLRELKLHYNRAAAGPAAEAYLKVIKSNVGFFVPTIKALEFKLWVGLHSYIGYKDDRSLGKIINKLQSEKAGVDLRKKYEEFRTKHKKIIDSMETMRDKRLAHDESVNLDETQTMSSDEQFISLFEDTKKLLNDVHGHFGNHILFMEDQARESIRDTHLMMNNLLRGESQRMVEIDVDLNDKLFESGREKWLKH